MLCCHALSMWPCRSLCECSAAGPWRGRGHLRQNAGATAAPSVDAPCGGRRRRPAPQSCRPSTILAGCRPPLVSCIAAPWVLGWASDQLAQDLLSVLLECTIRLAAPPLSPPAALDRPPVAPARLAPSPRPRHTKQERPCLWAPPQASQALLTRAATPRTGPGPPRAAGESSWRPAERKRQQHSPRRRSSRAPCPCTIASRSSLSRDGSTCR